MKENKWGKITLPPRICKFQSKNGFTSIWFPHYLFFFFICMNLFFLGSRLFCLYYFSYIRTPPAAANIECIKCINVFILKLIINCMLLPYYHWPVWLNGWVFVYELSGCGFESRCYHLNFRYGTGFKQGVLWHSGKL